MNLETVEKKYVLKMAAQFWWISFFRAGGVSAVPCQTDIWLTTFFAEYKEEFCSAVFDVSVDVCHDADNFVPQSTANLWSVYYIT